LKYAIDDSVSGEGWAASVMHDDDAVGGACNWARSRVQEQRLPTGVGFSLTL